ncbi:hypothetical protein [Capnocytophaga canimorsus]|uniref:hypothetical protein n=1 Tax=Capnocytophaga canimorsus TaxID=28188 RepID=UPI000D6E819A|nr:hypothetical protein [Capnocytophaga canimorsus]AWL79425.1 hypothetical protein DKB58_11000 [Capnocytophaga canimorsus]AYW36002.1 hypothetical protein D8L92_00730 [Capnocytophaga canimorsus]MDT9500575.1 hypothetical protein [Capnocytophaga canimorsus]
MQVEEIYLKIGQEVFNAVQSDNWTEAKLYLEVTGDEGNSVVGYTGDYKLKDKTIDLDIDYIDIDIVDWVADLHKITTEDGSNQWNKAIFTLFPNGNFDMEFIWDQAWHDEIVRLSKS